MPKFLTEEQVVILRQTHKALRDKKLADRIKAVLYLNYGLSYAETAKLLLLDEVTLRRYVEKYQREGIDGLLECHYVGGQTRLTVEQERELKAFLKENTLRTAKAVVAHIRKVYGVSFTVVGVTKLLHRLGFTYKKPKIVPGKADRGKQEEFLKKYQEIKGQLGKKDQVYFLDATHPQHNTRPSYGWILKGKENDKFIKTNSGRERLNLSGALSLRDHMTIVLEEETVNSEVTIKLFERLIKAQPTGKLYLILDNATYYHSAEVKTWLKKHRRFKPLFLPSYSPNLNLIERLWRFFHEKVTANHYFETLEEFREATLKFFNSLNLYKKELSTLLSDNFRLVPDLNSQT